MQEFRDKEFVIFDVETTGLSARMGDRMIEVAALRVRDLMPVEEFHSLIDPERALSLGAFLVNGISIEMLQAAPKREAILPALIEFFKDNLIVGHNIKFDLSFLCHETKELGFDFSDDPQALCTVKMSRALLPELGRYPLWYVAQTLGIETLQSHRALDDVRLTFDVFRRLLDIASRRDITDMTTLTHLFGQQKAKNIFELKRKTQLLEQAVSLQKTLSLVYFSQTQGGMTFRTVEPKELVKTRGKLFLKAFCQLRQEERLFWIDRICQLNDHPSASVS